MIVGGIDCGKLGYAVVVCTETMAVVRRWPQPLLADTAGDTWDRVGMLRIAQEMKSLGVRACGLELQLPGGRGRGTPQVFFRQGQSFGLWQMALQACDVPTIEATPQNWRKGLGVQQPRIAKARKGAPQGEEETAADDVRKKSQRDLGLIEVVRRVQSLFPTLDLRRTEKATTPCADLAVAVLIALFASGQRVDGAKARMITPEQAAAELEQERQAKAAEAKRRQDATAEKKRLEQEARDQKRKQRQDAKAEKARVTEEARAAKLRAREDAKAEKARVKAAKAAAKAAKAPKPALAW